MINLTRVKVGDIIFEIDDFDCLSTHVAVHTHRVTKIDLEKQECYMVQQWPHETTELEDVEDMKSLRSFFHTFEDAMAELNRIYEKRKRQCDQMLMLIEKGVELTEDTRIVRFHAEEDSHEAMILNKSF